MWLSTDFESLALLSRKHFIGLLVIHKHFIFRIPTQRPTESDCDVGKMASRYAAMLAEDVRDGRLFGRNALEEIVHVARDRIELSTS